MSEQEQTPRVSVVVPTYDRSAMLRQTLKQLTRQSIPADEFEVIVSDDGSTDDTKSVVDEFSDRLHISYTFQEDLGFRAATARNQGARLASAPLLVFLDTGALPGPGFLEEHLRAHGDLFPPKLCIGYAYGYNPEEPMSGHEEILDTLTPEDTVAHFAGTPEFLDLRHDELARTDFSLPRRTMPWSLTWSINISVSTATFRAAGGFDDEFVGWGGEDIELAYRLYLSAVRFEFLRDAWVIETPHERNWDILDKTFQANMLRFLAKHRQPQIEMAYRLAVKFAFSDWEQCSTELAGWATETAGRDVSGELAEVARDRGEGERIAVFGAGGVIPATLPPAVLFDFDWQLLGRALADGRHTGHYAIGLRVPLDDQSVDTVVITSRLDGLRERWSEDLLAEARRIGKHVIETGKH